MTALSRHEKVLLVLYRVAPMEVRGAIDAQLFDAWTHMSCSIDPDAPETVRHQLAVACLHADHLVGRALTGYASFWALQTKGGG